MEGGSSCATQAASAPVPPLLLSRLLPLLLVLGLLLLLLVHDVLPALGIRARLLLLVLLLMPSLTPAHASVPPGV